MKTNKLYFVGILVFLFSVSCSKSVPPDLPHASSIDSNEKALDGNGYQILDGIMCFDNSEAFRNLLKELASLPSNERVLWEKSHNFRSLWTASDEAMDVVSTAKSIEEAEEMLKNYDDFILFENIDGEKYLNNRVKSKAFSCISNENGVYIIGDRVYKVIDEYLIGCSTDRIGEVEKIDYQNLSTVLESNIFEIQKYVKKTSLKTGCGTGDDDEKFDIDDGNLKVTYEMRIVSYYHSLLGYQYADIEQSTINWKRTIFWFKNKANICHSGEFTINYTHNGNNGSASTNCGDCAYDEKELTVLYYCVTVQGYAQDWVCYFDSYDCWGNSNEVNSGGHVELICPL